MGSQDCDQNGVLRSYSCSPPCHYSLKVDSFSFMTENSLDGYESEKFDAGGHKWKLVIYPNGNKKRDVEVSLSTWKWLENMHFRVIGRYMLILDCFYLIRKAASTWFLKEHCFHHEMLRSPGFDRLMPLEEFTNASNGYVVDDSCVLGAEVFVCKEITQGKRERLLRINDAVMYKKVWKVENLSKLDSSVYKSEPFFAGNQKWDIEFYPKLATDQGLTFLFTWHCLNLNQLLLFPKYLQTFACAL